MDGLQNLRPDIPKVLWLEVVADTLLRLVAYRLYLAPFYLTGFGIG
jgi:hypothetical protein